MGDRFIDQLWDLCIKHPVAMLFLTGTMAYAGVRTGVDYFSQSRMYKGKISNCKVARYQVTQGFYEPQGVHKTLSHWEISRRCGKDKVIFIDAPPIGSLDEVEVYEGKTRVIHQKGSSIDQKYHADFAELNRAIDSR